MEWDFITIATLVVFCFSYASIAVGHVWGLKLDRAGIALLGAIAMMAFGGISLEHAVNSVNFRAILMLFGLMVVSGQLHYGGFYTLVAENISKFMEKPKIFLAILMLSSGLLSAILNNDVICFAFAPLITGALIKKKLNPTPFLIALALSSNIGCALTLIGNAQDLMIGQIAHLDFGSYIAWAILPVALSMTAAYFIVILIGGKNFYLKGDEIFKSSEQQEEECPFKVWRSTKGIIVTCTIVVLFFTPLPRYLVTLVGAGLLLCSQKLESKKVLRLVDWQLLILFIGLFIIVGAFHDSGLAQKGLTWVEAHGLDLKKPLVLTLTTGVLSNLINNSAAVMLLVKLVDLSNPTNGYIMALANTFAGNLFLIGSVANIIVVQCAENCGVKISFGKFAKYGIPTALASYAFLIIWILIMA